MSYWSHYRHGAMQVRENAGQIAFYGGAANELQRLLRRFAKIRHNVLAIVMRTAKLEMTRAVYGHVFAVLPTLTALARHFAGEITLGGVTQAVGAFGQLSASLGYPMPPQFDAAACRRVLGACGLTTRITSLYSNDNWQQLLSGGEQQRAAVADYHDEIIELVPSVPQRNPCRTDTSCGGVATRSFKMRQHQTRRSTPPMHPFTLQQKSFLLLLASVTIGFAWVLLPFGGAVFWGVVLGIVFAPIHRWLLKKTGQRPNLASFLTLLLIIVIVILPLTLVALSLVDQIASVVEMVRSGELTVGMFFSNVMAALPTWLVKLLDRFNLTSLASLQQKLTAAASQISQTLALQALNVSLYTVDFLTSLCIMLYLLFFLLRDGAALTTKIRSAVPLSQKYKQRLFSNFITVIRATVKGNILVAIAQGALGGLAFWFLEVRAPLLWAVLMAFLSLLPAIGAALVWTPVALYFLATGSIWEGVALIAWGVIVIGLVDNILRPVLVGKDTKMPDYIVLFSTVGGMALFGLNGFVIGPVVAALFIAAWDLFASASEFHTE